MNPHTQEVEIDTDQYLYRWKTDGDDVYYTNDEDDNPNEITQRTDYRRTPVRSRPSEQAPFLGSGSFLAWHPRQ